MLAVAAVTPDAEKLPYRWTTHTVDNPRSQYMTPELEKIGDENKKQKPGKIPIPQGTVSALNPFKKNHLGQGYKIPYVA